MTIILGYEAQQLHIENLMDHIIDSSTGRWEYYALLKTGMAHYRIPAEARHRFNLKIWQDIQGTLNSDERDIFNQWVLKHQEQYPELESPLPTFTNLFHAD